MCLKKKKRKNKISSGWSMPKDGSAFWPNQFLITKEPEDCQHCPSAEKTKDI